MSSLDQAIRAAIADENRRFMADPEAIAEAQAENDLFRRRLEGRGGIFDRLVRAEVRTHDPSKYTLHNSEDGTVWQMTATGSWKEIQ